MNKQGLILVIVLWLGVAIAAPVKVVLLAGQSNMAGAGNYQELSAEQKARVEKAATKVTLGTGYSHKPLSYYVSRSKSKKYGFTDFFGPELFIGVTLHEANPEQDYLFIKTAVGSTALYGAWNPEWSAEKIAQIQNDEKRRKLKLVSEHQESIRFHLNRLKQEGRAYEIIGMAWMQGEADSRHAFAAEAYGDNLKKLIASYRTEFNVPAMPFVMGQMNMVRGDFYEPLRAGQQAVADADPLVSLIPTSLDPAWSDFPKHTDNTHYNTEGQVRLGTAFAEQLQQF